MTNNIIILDNLICLNSPKEQVKFSLDYYFYGFLSSDLLEPGEVSKVVVFLKHSNRPVYELDNFLNFS